ncbi:MAG: hypothetical protein EXS08_12990 [Planctomycetes bacterium]|nr:hypothetical protein [Planctomycetota bacterium]
MQPTLRWISVLPLLCFGAPSAAQSNQVPGMDIRLSNMRTIDVLGREGVFPNGRNGVAIETTVCNEGSVEVPWMEAMNIHHPTIAFLVAAARNGRMEQISDRSYVKHGFFALNGNGCQLSCVPPGVFGSMLGVGCTDTYATANNGDNFYLGSPDEIDPWLGVWNKQCSFFDRGFPDVGAPANCDGRRSLTHQMASNLGVVGSRVHLSDEDLVIGGELFFQGHYVVEGLPEAARDDALGSRPFAASWGGSRWTLTQNGPLVPGSILKRWSGATVTSNTNGSDDGLVFAALKVTGPSAGFYHYEYALHNRDNARGVGALRIPLCSGARLRNLAFHDIDLDANNDWTASVSASEIEFATASAPLRWNTLFNFSFDCDAGPADGALVLAEFDAGTGLAQFTVPGQAPLALYNAYLGAGCAQGTPPTLYAIGSPARAELGNASFGVASDGNAPSQVHQLYFGTQAGSLSLQGCTIWAGPSLGALRFASTVLSDANGIATHPGAIPNDLALEGAAFRMQAVSRRPGQGVLFTNFELSDGLLVRLGNSIPGCP